MSVLSTVRLDERAGDFGGGSSGKILGMDPWLLTSLLVVVVLIVAGVLVVYMYKSLRGPGLGILIGVNPRTNQVRIERKALTDYGADVKVDGKEKLVPLLSRLAKHLKKGPLLWGSGPVWFYDSVTGLPYDLPPTDPDGDVDVSWIDGRDLAVIEDHMWARELNENDEGGFAGFLNKNVGLLVFFALIVLFMMMGLLMYIAGFFG